MDWEYKVVVIPLHFGKPDNKSSAEIAVMGDEGWELVAVTPINDKGNTSAIMHHLRRPKNQERRAGFAP